MSIRTESIKVIDFIDALGLAGILTSVDGESACSSVISYVSDPEKIAKADREVTGATYNSREAAKGSLFVCKGAHFREKYLEDAVNAGAVCYVREDPKGKDGLTCSITDAQESSFEKRPGCIGITVSDIRKAMPVLGDLYYDHPQDKLKITAFGGTKGKSTSTYYMKYVVDEYLSSLGKAESAVLSSIDNYDGVIREESHITTAESLELHMHFDNAVSSGMEFLEMEDPMGPYGNKALGEPPVIPVAPAIRNAILNATGVSMKEIPMTQQKLVAAFQEAGLI